LQRQFADSKRDALDLEAAKNWPAGNWFIELLETVGETADQSCRHVAVLAVIIVAR
jgi:hypothetical protein